MRAVCASSGARVWLCEYSGSRSGFNGGKGETVELSYRRRRRRGQLRQRFRPKGLLRLLVDRRTFFAHARTSRRQGVAHGRWERRDALAVGAMSARVGDAARTVCSNSTASVKGSAVTARSEKT